MDCTHCYYFFWSYTFRKIVDILIIYTLQKNQKNPIFNDAESARNPILLRGMVPQYLFPCRTILSPAMAFFECDRCGKCCVSLGPHIIVERQLNDRDYYCRSVIDNVIFHAHVDPEYREEIADEFETGDAFYGPEKKTCRFLRKNHNGNGTVCVNYEARPKVCRDFRCYRMLIRTREGIICGRVIGKNTILTEDPALQKLWNEHVASFPYGDFTAWTKNVAGILAEHGYCADPIE
jgi:Fe-S-cluster containining protein